MDQTQRNPFQNIAQVSSGPSCSLDSRSSPSQIWPQPHIPHWNITWFPISWQSIAYTQTSNAIHLCTDERDVFVIRVGLGCVLESSEQLGPDETWAMFGNGLRWVWSMFWLARLHLGCI